MLADKFSNEDLWKGIILFGLNAATYKMALAKSLFGFARENKSEIRWEELAASFLDQYVSRLTTKQMPQQGNPARLTVMERIVKEFKSDVISYSDAVSRVEKYGLDNVIPRFQTIGLDKSLRKGHFYTFEYGKKLNIKDCLLSFSEMQ